MPHVNEHHTPEAQAVKTISEQRDGMITSGYLLLWGSPARKDLQGDFFRPSTKLYLDHYDQPPVLWHHGLDKDVGANPIGYRLSHKKDDRGLWVEHWLDKSAEYFSLIKELVAAGVVYLSPGSIPHMIERAADGELKSWPVVEDSLTPTPANAYLLDRPVSQIKAPWQQLQNDLKNPAISPEQRYLKFIAGMHMAGIDAELAAIQARQQAAQPLTREQLVAECNRTIDAIDRELGNDRDAARRWSHEHPHEYARAYNFLRRFYRV